MAAISALDAADYEPSQIPGPFVEKDRGLWSSKRIEHGAFR
jgi:hypothetical protein